MFIEHFQIKPKQLVCIDNIINGKDVLAILPTGYGKSYIYQTLPRLFSAGSHNNTVIENGRQLKIGQKKQKIKKQGKIENKETVENVRTIKIKQKMENTQTIGKSKIGENSRFKLKTTEIETKQKIKKRQRKLTDIRKRLKKRT